MHKSEQSSSDDDGPESPASDSDDARSSGSRSRPRHLYPHQYAKRMSLLSPNGFASNNLNPDIMDAINVRPQNAARRFFHSAAVWDPTRKTVLLKEAGAMGGGEPMNVGLSGPGIGMKVERMSVPLRHASEMEDDVEMDAEGEETWREADTSIAVDS